MLFILNNHSKSLVTEITNINWTAFVLGLSIVGLEFGYVYMYRAGWKISVGSLVANISLACVLLLLGILMYKETVSIRQLIGILVCISGLIMISTS